jgi:hypothetical protein
MYYKELNEVLNPGDVVIYVDEQKICLWREGACIVRILDAESGNEVDCMTFHTAPSSISQALEWARDHFNLVIPE